MEQTAPDFQFDGGQIIRGHYYIPLTAKISAVAYHHVGLGTYTVFFYPHPDGIEPMQAFTNHLVHAAQELQPKQWWNLRIPDTTDIITVRACIYAKLEEIEQNEFGNSHSGADAATRKGVE